MDYPELMFQLETLYNYYIDMRLEEADPTADALWVAIEAIQYLEHRDGWATNLLKQFEEQRLVDEASDLTT